MSSTNLVRTLTGQDIMLRHSHNPYGQLILPENLQIEPRFLPDALAQSYRDLYLEVLDLDLQMMRKAELEESIEKSWKRKASDTDYRAYLASRKLILDRWMDTVEKRYQSTGQEDWVLSQLKSWKKKLDESSPENAIMNPNRGNFVQSYEGYISEYRGSIGELRAFLELPYGKAMQVNLRQIHQARIDRFIENLGKKDLMNPKVMGLLRAEYPQIFSNPQFHFDQMKTQKVVKEGLGNLKRYLENIEVDMLRVDPKSGMEYWVEVKNTAKPLTKERFFKQGEKSQLKQAATSQDALRMLNLEGQVKLEYFPNPPFENDLTEALIEKGFRVWP